MQEMLVLNKQLGWLFLAFIPTFFYVHSFLSHDESGIRKEDPDLLWPAIGTVLDEVRHL